MSLNLGKYSLRNMTNNQQHVAEKPKN